MIREIWRCIKIFLRKIRMVVMCRDDYNLIKHCGFQGIFFFYLLLSWTVICFGKYHFLNKDNTNRVGCFMHHAECTGRGRECESSMNYLIFYVVIIWKDYSVRYCSYYNSVSAIALFPWLCFQQVWVCNLQAERDG